MSTHKKTKIVGLNGCGSPKVTEGKPKIFACSINIGELDRVKGLFPIEICENML